MKTSLCISSYDQDIHLIDKLLYHINKQTIKPDEVILFCSGVDNVKISNDTIPVKTYIKKDRQIQSHARNFSAQRAVGDIIIFFDIDDIPHPQKIETTLKYIDKYDFLIHSYSRSLKPFNAIDFTKLEFYDNLEIDTNCTNIKCHTHPIHHAHIAIKRTVMDKISFNEDMSYHEKEDGKFCQDLLLNNFKGVFINYPLVIYT